MNQSSYRQTARQTEITYNDITSDRTLIPMVVSRLYLSRALGFVLHGCL